MCLGIPGQITAISDAERKLARVEISGVTREVNLAPVVPDDGNLESLIGRWTLIHVGFAMSLIDEAEAAKTLALLAELGEVQEELRAMRSSAAE